MTWTGDHILGFCLLSGLLPGEHYIDDVSIRSILIHHGRFNETKDPWKVNVCMFCDDVMTNDFKMCLQEGSGISVT